MTSTFEYRVGCPTCQQKQIARERAEYHVDGMFDPKSFIRYAFAECTMCSSLLVLRQTMEVQQEGFGFQEKWRRQDAEVIWPQVERILSDAIPEAIRHEHQEARSCFRAKAYTATLVMVRRTLEGVCFDHQINSKPLYKALEEMQSKGLIEGRLFDWAQALRILGNEAAHFTGKAVSRQDASDALELAEALMDYLYVFTKRFNEFQQRRSSAAQVAPQDAPSGDAPSQV